jgi:hypothetical protein
MMGVDDSVEGFCEDYTSLSFVGELSSIQRPLEPGRTYLRWGILSLLVYTLETLRRRIPLATIDLHIDGGIPHAWRLDTGSVQA